MRRLSLGAKMYLMLVPLCVMGIVAGSIALAGLRSNASDLVRARQVKELAVTSLALLLTQDDASKTMILDPLNSASGVRKIKAYDANTALLARICALAGPGEITKLVERLIALDQTELRDIDTAVLEAIGDGKLDEAKQLYFVRYEPARARYEAVVRQLCDAAEASALAAAQTLEGRNRISFLYICGALGAGILIVSFCVIALARIVSSKLNATVLQLKKEADITGCSSSALKHSSEELASGAFVTADSLDKTAVSLQDMERITRSNAETAMSASRLSHEAVSAADLTAQDMHEMTIAMETIQASSASVSQIIRTIDTIAFQTNILALNAAVEAARAGESGLGFAVVATEVRNLAQRSAKAACDTAQLIQDAIDKSRDGVEISARVARRMDEITSTVRRVHVLVAGIAEACRSQESEFGEINGAIGKIHVVTKSTALSAQRSAEVADEFALQARSLDHVVLELLQLVAAENHAKPRHVGLQHAVLS